MTQTLIAGQNVGLAQSGLSGPVVATLTWTEAPGVDADLSPLR